MLDERWVYANGEFVKWRDATVHLMSHSLGRGTAVFEVASVHETEAGPAIFRLDRHLDRLHRTADLLHMTLSVGRDELHEACLGVVRKNEIKSGFVKIICYYSGIAFELLPPDVPLDVSIFVVDPDSDLGGVHFLFETGTTACFSRWRKLDPETVPVEAKVSANYLNGMMAKTESRARGYEDAILLDSQGFVAEGGTESVFMVENGGLFTAAAGTVLLSVTRLSLLQMAEALRIPTAECRIHKDRLYNADEIIFAGTPNKVLPVRKIEDREVRPCPGPVAKRLSAFMQEITSGESDRFRDWLFPV